MAAKYAAAAWKCTKCGAVSEVEGVGDGDNWCGSCGACGTMMALHDRDAIDEAVTVERQRAADACAQLAWAMEHGAGETKPGERLRQAQRLILEGAPTPSYMQPEMRVMPA